MSSKEFEDFLKKADYMDPMTREKISQELHIPEECIKRFGGGFSIDGKGIEFPKNLWVLCDERTSFYFHDCCFKRPIKFENTELAKISFSSCVFEEEFSIQDCHFQDLEIAKCTFKKNVSFESCKFKDRTSFYQTNFERNVSFHYSHFYENVSFLKTRFLSPYRKQKIQKLKVEQGVKEIELHIIDNPRIDFRGITAEKRFSIQESSFSDKVNFSGSKFYDQTTFTKIRFEAPCDIDASEVEGSFEGVVFEKKVAFTNIAFEGRFSFEKADFSSEAYFKEVKFLGCNPIFLEANFAEIFQIEQKYLRYEHKDLEKKENPSIWRELFCKLKSNRLAHHNLIDASELHTQELYARELELGKKGRGIRDEIEKWQLHFYRLTSDHHTDLAKIFNNVILLIALFGIFSFGSVKYGEKHLDYERQYFGSVQTSAIDLSVRKTSYSLTKSELKAEKQDLQNLSWNQNNFSESFSIAILCFSFVVSFVGLISLDCLKNKFWIKARNILSYLSVFGVLVFKPALLFPFVGEFLESSPTDSFPAMQSLSVVYCVLMFLMLFSLQKTARKNSIIPS